MILDRAAAQGTTDTRGSEVYTLAPLSNDDRVWAAGFWAQDGMAELLQFGMDDKDAREVETFSLVIRYQGGRRRRNRLTCVVLPGPYDDVLVTVTLASGIWTAHYGKDEILRRVVGRRAKNGRERLKQKRTLARILASHEQLSGQWTASSQYLSLQAIVAYATETGQEVPAWVTWNITLHNTARKHQKNT